MAVQVKMVANGRIGIPVALRKRLGVDDGDTLVLQEIENGLVLRTVPQSVANARALLKQYESEGAETSVDEFLALRKLDSRE